MMIRLGISTAPRRNGAKSESVFMPGFEIGSQELLLDHCFPFCALTIKRIVGVAARIEGVESAAVILVERQPFAHTPGKIRIRQKMTPECDGICMSASDRFFRVLRVEYARRH